MEYPRLRYQSMSGSQIVQLLGTGNRKGYPTISIMKPRKLPGSVQVVIQLT